MGNLPEIKNLVSCIYDQLRVDVTIPFRYSSYFDG